MPSSITVNLMTTQHKVSVGITTAFPDVCKTPAPPAPSPVPIPYPNVGLSGMAAIKVTKRVGDDTGQKVMLMGSSYSLTSGDEPGVALGIISNRVKGKSSTKSSSFNVKFEGKGVSRLTDPHGNNSGSTPNAFSPAEMQGPRVAIDTTAVAESKREACDKLEKNRVPKDPPGKPSTHKAVARQAGMREKDYTAMRKVCAAQDVCVSFRDTNRACRRHMNRGVGSKGHNVLTKTFERNNLPKGEKGLAGLVSVLDKKPKGPLFDTKGKLTKEARKCIAKDKNGKRVIDASKVTKAEDLLYKDKKGNPLTGDYDMNDMFDKNGKRIRGGPKEKSLERKLNKAMGKPNRVKHGAQANFYDFVRSDQGKKEMKALKKQNKPFPKGLMQAGIDPGKGEGLTVFDGSAKPPKEGKVYRLNTPEDVINMYRCKGQKVPAKWRYKNEKGRAVKI